MSQFVQADVQSNPEEEEEDKMLQDLSLVSPEKRRDISDEVILEILKNTKLTTEEQSHFLLDWRYKVTTPTGDLDNISEQLLQVEEELNLRFNMFQKDVEKALLKQCICDVKNIRESIESIESANEITDSDLFRVSELVFRDSKELNLSSTGSHTGSQRSFWIFLYAFDACLYSRMAALVWLKEKKGIEKLVTLPGVTKFDEKYHIEIPGTAAAPPSTELAGMIFSTTVPGVLVKGEIRRKARVKRYLDPTEFPLRPTHSNTRGRNVDVWSGTILSGYGEIFSNTKTIGAANQESGTNGLIKSLDTTTTSTSMKEPRPHPEKNDNIIGKVPLEPTQKHKKSRIKSNQTKELTASELFGSMTVSEPICQSSISEPIDPPSMQKENILSATEHEIKPKIIENGVTSTEEKPRPNRQEEPGQDLTKIFY